MEVSRRNSFISPKLSIEKIQRSFSMENVKKSPRSCEKCGILNTSVQYRSIQKGSLRIQLFQCEKCYENKNISEN